VAEGDWESSSIKGLLDIWMLCGCCWSMMEHPSSCGRVLRFRQKITVLHEASFRGQADAILLLLKHNADVKAGNEDNEMPLHVASLRGKASARGQVLLEHGYRQCTRQNPPVPLYQASKRGGVSNSRLCGY
jgi:hypothetical protein